MSENMTGIKERTIYNHAGNNKWWEFNPKFLQCDRHWKRPVGIVAEISCQQTGRKVPPIESLATQDKPSCSKLEDKSYGLTWRGMDIARFTCPWNAMHEGIPLRLSIEIFGDNWSATLWPHSVMRLTIMIVMFNFFLHSMTVTEFKNKIKERTDEKSINIYGTCVWYMCCTFLTKLKKCL